MKPNLHLPQLAQRLDLAKEATEILRGSANIEISGIAEEVQTLDGITVHTVTVLNDQGSQAIQKPCGKYLTLEMPPLENTAEIGNAANIIAQQLTQLLPKLEDQTLLVVGLGNHDAVPDSLGPAVVAKTYATRHIFVADQEPAGIARICSLAPGVLGISGIETAEIIKGVADRLHPAAMIVVDALAAASIRRVGNTIQITDSGISPGSGIGKGRARLDAESLGCPVIAIGVPTVVDTAAIIHETMAAISCYWQTQGQAVPPELTDAAYTHAETSLLEIFRGRLMVTPKDIDELIADMAELISAAIAIAIHPACDNENYLDFIR